MKAKTTSELLGPLFRFAKRLASALKEKPRSSLDEYVMEHILLYHGLVGSTPENQRQFRDVRADVVEAIQKNSSVELAIALKLPPLLWEEKLQSVLGELEPELRDLAIPTLLPDSADGELPAPADPLSNDDWRVRANAANMLAFLQAEDAIPRLAEALADSTTGTTKPAFCHIAYALGRLRRDRARQTLLPYLNSDEPWFRVDAARALSLWPRETVVADLMRAMMSNHPLSDYMAVAIARQHPPVELLKHPDPQVAEGALEMIICVIAGASQTHPQETVVETGVLDCWVHVFEMYRQHPTPRRLRAARALALWARDNAELLQEHIDLSELVPSPAAALADVSSPSNDSMLLNRLGKLPASGGSDDQGELRHAVYLSGELKVATALPMLLSLLRPDVPLVDEAIDALGRLGDARAVEPLTKLVEAMVDNEDRDIGTLSQYPVEEEDSVGARRYWAILRALGNLPPTDAGVSLLLKASRDFAPDKRQQALESLVASLSQGTAGDITEEIKLTIRAAMHDPSVPVRMAGLGGIARFQLIEDLESVIKTSEAREVSLRNKAFETLRSLSSNHGSAVTASVQSRLKYEHDPHRRKRLENFLENPQGVRPSI